MITLTLVVTDDQGQMGEYAMEVSGPELPMSSICRSGYDTPSESLAVEAFARMFGYSKNRVPHSGGQFSRAV